MSDPIKHSCRLDYFPAYHHSGIRPLEAVYWIVVHDEEAPTAQSAAAYFELKASGGSAALSVDDQTCYRSLANDQVAWGASSAPGLSANYHGFHIEHAGYAKWLPGQWRLHPKTIERGSFKTAAHLHVFRLPCQWVTAAQLVAGVRTGHVRKGVTSHREISAASRILDPANAWRYSHSDPGLFFPRRRYMSLAAGFLAELEGKGPPL